MQSRRLLLSLTNAFDIEYKLSGGHRQTLWQFYFVVENPHDIQIQILIFSPPLMDSEAESDSDSESERRPKKDKR